MGKVAVKRSQGRSRTVYTSGVSEVDKAMWNHGGGRSMDSSTIGRSQQLEGVNEPLPSQKYTYQRGLAKAALRLPQREQLLALADVLEAMGLQRRVFRPTETSEGE